MCVVLGHFNFVENMKNIVTLLVSFFLFGIAGYSQGVSINETNAAPDPSAILHVQSITKGVLIPRMSLVQRNAIQNPATGLLIYQTDMDPGYYTYTGTGWVLASTTGKHYVGEFYGGGIVVYVDYTGQHGLVASLVDVAIGQKYSNILAQLGVSGESDWNGSENTNAVVNQSGHTSSSAKLCLDYTNTDYGTGIFDDWYLPSRGEMNNIWDNLQVVQQALTTDNNPQTTTLLNTYWTSTEYNADSAWIFTWINGTVAKDKKNQQKSIRAVRSF